MPKEETSRKIISMKLLTLSLVITLAYGNTTDKSDCPVECVTDGSVDYFPDKVEFEDSTCLSVSYHDYYKVATYDCEGETATILYVQCGCPVPVTITPSTTVTVPISTFGVQSTTMMSFVHSLGLLDRIEIEINSGWGNTSNQCFLDNVKSGVTTQLIDTVPWDLDTTSTTIDMIFHNPGFTYSGNLTNPVIFAEYNEKTFLSQSEWVKYLALPFNMERTAGEVYKDVKDTVGCIDANTKTYMSYHEPESFTVMLGGYSTWGGAGWAMNPPCDVYKSRYCKIFDDLGVEMVGNGDTRYPPKLTDEEFKLFAENVDVWISTSQMNATQMEIDHPFLTDLRSWKNKRVYDVAKRGQDDWYSSIGTQASVLHEDFAAVTHGPDFSFLDATGTHHTTVFLRDIFNEDVGNFGECKGKVFGTLAEVCEVFAEIDLTGVAERVGGEIAMVFVAAAVVTQALAMMVGI